MHRFSIFFIFFYGCLLHLSAQNESHSLQIIGKSFSHEIQLRWAPSTPLLWQIANKSGYVLERWEINTQGKLLKDSLLFPPQIIKPYDLSQFEALSKQEPNAEIVQEMIYGESFAQASPHIENPAHILQKNQLQEARFGFALLLCDIHPSLAKAAGLSWVDKSIQKGKKYAYQIRLNQVIEKLKIAPGVIVLAVEPSKPLLAPKDVQANFTDLKVSLQWSILLHKGVYTAYIIEKSSNGKDFQAVSEHPFSFVSEEENPSFAYFVDSLTNNVQTFYYRIKGISPFGQISPPSEVVKGEGKANLAGQISIQNAQIFNNQKVILNWTFPSSFASQIKGFYVAKSPQSQGIFQNVSKLLPASQTTFEDVPKINNVYYQIKVMGKNNEVLTQSFPYFVQLEDKSPPAIPRGLAGKVDEKGLVSLHWLPNQEADLLGYRVFRANGLQEEVVEVSREILGQSNFSDTIQLNTLTKKIYYQIIAVDKNYNTSPYSSVLVLQRPDKIAPVAPVFKQLIAQKNGIELNWQKSPSEDIKQYELYRQIKGDTNQIPVKTWLNKTCPSQYLDENIQVGKTYRYTLVVKDSANNQGLIRSGEILFETGIRPAVSNIKTAVNREKRNITLTWEYPPTDISRTIIYRAMNQELLQIYQTLVGNPAIFVDTHLSINNTYTYYVKLYFKNGVSTGLSEALLIKY